MASEHSVELRRMAAGPVQIIQEAVVPLPYLKKELADKLRAASDRLDALEAAAARPGGCRPMNALQGMREHLAAIRHDHQAGDDVAADWAEHDIAWLCDALEDTLNALDTCKDTIIGLRRRKTREG